MYKHFMKVVYNFHESYKHFIHMAESFSKILLKFKNDYRLTQRAIADILGISERMYIMYEKGDYDGSQKRIEKYQKKINDFIEKENKILSGKLSVMSEPDTSAEYGKKPPDRIDDLLLIIKNLEARIKDKEEIILLMRDKINRAEIIEKLFISALHSPRTLKEFHSLIESSFVS